MLKWVLYLYLTISSILQGVAITMFVYILMGWIVAIVQPKRNNVFTKIYSFLEEKFEPIFMYCRQFVPPIMGFDFSPIFVSLVLEGLRYLLGLLFSLFLRF